ncbi:MAG: GxxExxY protein [Bacteroidetes bacterium]|nr:GxxExxY protein [Bacteroidota bacterium]
MDLSQKYLDDLTYEVLGAVIEVHKSMGRGLLENVYQECLKEELRHRKINFLTEFKIPVIYRDKELEIGFRCDMFIENCLVLELKAVQDISNNYEAQLLNYMKLLNLKAPKGLLVNFNCNNIFNEGQKTYVNEYFKQLPRY